MQTTYTTNTNYVQNPNFEVDLTYWSAINGTLTRQGTTTYQGSYTAQLVTQAVYDAYINVSDSSTYQGVISVVESNVLSINVSDSTVLYGTYSINGTSYPLSGQVTSTDSSTTSDSAAVAVSTLPSGYENYGSIVTTINGTAGKTYVGQAMVQAPSGTQLYIQFKGLNQSGIQIVTANGSWQQLVTSPIAADQATFQLQIGTSTPGTTMYIDAVQVEIGLVPTAYFDGSMGVGYSWLGVANYSVSLYRAYNAEANSRSQTSAYNILISWQKNTSPTYQPFTIGTSTIGGPNYMPSSNGTVGVFGMFAYSDYSDYGISWSLTRNLGQYPYGVIMGSASVVLDNNSNLFTPGNDPTIGNYILPQRPLILSSGYADIGETINVFEGLTTMPQNSVDDRTTTLNAYDFVTYLSSFTSTTTPDQLNQRADYIIQQLLLEAGFTSSQFVLEPSLQQPIGYFSCYGKIVTDMIQELCEAEQGIFFCDENGILRFWNRQHIFVNNTTQWNFNYDTILDVKQGNAPIINDVIVTANPRAAATKRQIFTLSDTVLIPAAQPQSNNTTNLRNMLLNPSFEVDTNTWSIYNSQAGYNAPTNVRVASGYNTGATPSNYSLQSTGTQSGPSSYSSPQALVQSGSSGTPAGFNNPNFNLNSTNYNKQNFPFVPGQTYTIQARIKGNAGETGSVGWRYISAYNGRSELSGDGSATLTGGWDLVTYTFQAPDAYALDQLAKNGTYGYGGWYAISVMTSNSTGGTAWFDQVSVTEGSTASQAYFDGSTPNSQYDTYAWEGTAQESSSTQTIITSIPVSYTYTVNFNDPATSVDTPTYAQPLLTSTSSYNTNTNKDGSGQSYSSYISITGTKLIGGNYSITFQNSWTQPLYLTGLTLYGTPALVYENINQEYRNSNSVSLYGLNPANNYAAYTINNDAIQDSGTALALAYSLVLDYGQPNARISIDVVPVPSLQFGDWVSVYFEDTGITQTYVIVGITLGLSADDGLVQTLELEAHTATQYFTINNSSIGGADSIAP